MSKSALKSKFFVLTRNNRSPDENRNASLTIY